MIQSVGLANTLMRSFLHI